MSSSTEDDTLYPGDPLISRKQLYARLGISTATGDRWALSGALPKPIRLGPKGAKRPTYRYRLSVVLAWLDERGGA
jgi:predicted DNA-binding transcriptional regulator AlpA